MAIIYKWIQDEVTIYWNTDFVYITSSDHDTALQFISPYLNSENKKQEVYLLYSQFIQSLLFCLDDFFIDKWNIEIHFYDDKEIANALYARTTTKSVISLDPSITTKENILFIRSSRFFDCEWIHYKWQYPHSQSQIFLDGLNILSKHFWSINDLTILDDDTYTGSTLNTICSYYHEHSINISSSIVGIKIGNNSKAEGIITYKLESWKDPTKTIDIGDCRDFLIWSSGLVVDIGDWMIGRAPYILPFVSPNIRMWISKNREKYFSQRVVNINKDFYFKLEKIINRNLTLNDINKESFDYFKKYYTNLDWSRTILWLLESFTL